MSGIEQEIDSHFGRKLRELREAAKEEYRIYLYALHSVGAREGQFGRGLQYDTLLTAAMLVTNLHERVFLRDPAARDSDELAEIRSGNITNDNILYFLHFLRSGIPEALDEKKGRHPSAQLKPEGLIGLSALCKLPTWPEDRRRIKSSAIDLLSSHDRYAYELYRSNGGIFNGQYTDMAAILRDLSR